MSDDPKTPKSAVFDGVKTAAVPEIRSGLRWLASFVILATLVFGAATAGLAAAGLPWLLASGVTAIVLLALGAAGFAIARGI